MGAKVGDDSAPGRGAWLIGIGRQEGSRRFRVAGRRITVGSAADNGIVLTDKTVSRHHALILRRLRGFDVADLGSTNGTFINGRRISALTTIRRNAEISFGKARFRFVAGRSVFARVSRLVGSVAILAAIFYGAFFLTRKYLTRAEFNAGVQPAARVSIAARNEPAARVSTAVEPRIVSHTTARAANVAPSSRATPSGPEPEWLARLNEYRAMVGLARVTEDPALSAGDRAHVDYLFENLGPSLRRGTNPGIDAHLESPGKPGYSDAGARAGRSSDVDFVTFSGIKVYYPGGSALVDWISGPFHRLPLLSPRLVRAGFYQRCARGLCISALDAQSEDKVGPFTVAYAAPIEFPAHGAAIHLTTFTAEWPNPLSACAGYTAPSGLPITLSTGTQMFLSLESYKFERLSASGVASALDACGFDFSTYTNLDPVAQKAGRQVLAAEGTVVVVPRAPLVRGATYRVSIKASGQFYQWRFSVSR